MGWGTVYSLYSTGKLIPDQNAFIRNFCEWFLATLIYTSLPLQWVQFLWSNRIFRWSVFILDQSSANGYGFIPLFKSEIANGSGLVHGIFILISKAVARPVSQIITGYYNSNLWGKNLIKWSTIMYLNSGRVLTLTLLNWLSFNSFHDIG